MKMTGLLLLAFLMQGCLYHSYFKDKDSEWSYFEDWDLNGDRFLDKDEFTNGFLKDKIFKKVSPRSEPLSCDDFDKLITKTTEKSGDKSAEKPRASSFDSNGDQRISKEESAVAMFAIADDNADKQVSSLEFYDWEVYL